MKKLIYLLLLCLPLLGLSAKAQENRDVTKVYVIFKTHLDVGFTDLSSVVTDRYVHEFIPKAIEVSERLEAEGSRDHYVWTTGSWLIWKYLHEAPVKEVKRLEEAIRKGNIVWNAVPYTVESETMNRDLFATSLKLAKVLDKRYGKHTIAAKMTDVPGHTRGIIAPLSQAGIRFLHIGVNSACPVPDVPPFCRWRDSEGNELILAYQKDYGEESILPDGKTAVSVRFTGDNHGPHRYEDVKRIYADIRSRYPKAEVVGASFNEVAALLWDMREKLPVVTSEIGDTWIYGYGGAPVRMAKFRALSRLFSRWLAEGKLSEEEALNFTVELGLIAEHTQGVDVKTHLRHWDAYDMDKFQAERSALSFSKAEQSWAEIDAYLGSAIRCLPEALRAEAVEALARIDRINLKKVENNVTPSKQTLPLMGSLRLEGLSYQTLDAADYEDYFDRYLRTRPDWALADQGKPGLENSHAVNGQWKAETTAQSVTSVNGGTRTLSELAFPLSKGMDKRMCPERMQTEVWVADNGKEATVSCTLYRKPAVRLPEAYWLSFNADDITSVIAEKTGERIDLLDVVKGGNRQMHGIDRYVDILTSHGTYRIWSDEAFLLQVGEPCGLDYSTELPDPKGGVHFCLANNLWGTNFSMWWEGSLTFHFRIERLNP